MTQQPRKQSNRLNEDPTGRWRNKRRARERLDKADKAHKAQPDRDREKKAEARERAHTVEDGLDRDPTSEAQAVEFAKFVGAIAAIGMFVSLGAALTLLGFSTLVSVFGWLTSGFNPLS